MRSRIDCWHLYFNPLKIKSSSDKYEPQPAVNWIFSYTYKPHKNGRSEKWNVFSSLRFIYECVYILLDTKFCIVDNI